MSNTVIGLFESAGEASEAREQLTAAGVPAADIQVSSQDAAAPSGAAGYEDKGFWESVKEMFGAAEPTAADGHASYYAEGARRGGAVLKVEASDAQVDSVADILRAAGAVDVDAKATEWRSAGWTGPASTGTASAGATASAAVVASTDAASKIDVVKEDLAIGKRVVNRGGVRIVKRTIERPVEQDVQLREEHVSVDRRVADRPLPGADASDAFKEQTIELTESGEEVVASKTARVVGEVVIGKTVEQRGEKVRDSLRETDVQVEQLPGQSVSASSKTIDEPGPADKTRTAVAGS